MKNKTDKRIDKGKFFSSLSLNLEEKNLMMTNILTEEPTQYYLYFPK